MFVCLYRVNFLLVTTLRCSHIASFTAANLSPTIGPVFGLCFTLDRPIWHLPPNTMAENDRVDNVEILKKEQQKNCSTVSCTYSKLLAICTSYPCPVPGRDNVQFIYTRACCRLFLTTYILNRRHGRRIDEAKTCMENGSGLI